MQPPFNEAARAQAGFGPEWYMPIAAAPNSTPAGDAGAQQQAASVAMSPAPLIASGA